MTFKAATAARYAQPDRQQDGVEIGLLGPLFVRAGSREATPSAPKLRCVLATLAANAGQVVSVSTLMRELWDEDPPASWLTTLQTYVLNLRKQLALLLGTTTADTSTRLLVTESGGYVLCLPNGGLDLTRYQRLAGRGRELLGAGDDQAAVRCFNDALQVWRGPALVDVNAGRILDSKRRQIEGSRLEVLEHSLDAQMRLGMFHEAAGELVALIAENPLNEAIHARYMLALYNLDRRAEALEVFRRLRETLVEELGLEPGMRVREMHQAILDADSLHEIPLPRRQQEVPGAFAWERARAY